MTSSSVESASETKEVWLVVEPSLYVHSAGYVRAILDNDLVEQRYDVLFVYAVASPETCILDEIVEDYGSRFRPFRVPFDQGPNPVGAASQIARAWKVLREVNRLAAEEKADRISFLGIDGIVRLLGIPGMQRLFPSIRGRATGVFFNSRCYRESSFSLGIHAALVTRAISSGF